MGRLTDKRIAELTVFGGNIATNHESAAELREMAQEIRERRAQDSARFDATVAVMPDDGGKVRRVFLSGRDVEALVDMLEHVGSIHPWSPMHRVALAALSKLTRGNR